MLGRIFIIGGLLAAAAGHAFGQSGVTIESDQFGPGNAYRPGDITAIRLKLTSNLAAPTPVWVQWQVANGDGDIGEYGRSLTLTPNQPALTWLYAPLPPDVTPSSVWTVRVFEERDGQRRGEIGGNRISPGGSQFVDIGAGMIAVVGQSRMGLDGYGNNSGVVNARSMRPFGAHEDTRIIPGLKPSQVPDRWYGLLPYEAVAWSGDNTPPQELGLDQAEAIREWVRWGGHLIISLPANGNPWGLGVAGQTELEELLPSRAADKMPRTDNAVTLADLLPTISKYNSVSSLIGNRKPPEFTIRVFKDLRGDFNVIDNHYEPLIALNDGRVIAIQRQFGFGRVTVLGLDLSDGRLGALGLPQADAFWNRILGRRVDTPTGLELNALSKDKRLGSTDANRENALGAGMLIADVINMRGEAGKGLLLALMLFAIYWVLAGPGGFGLLKHYGKAHHAWVAFALCAGVFTVIAWGGVNLFPKRVQISHVTVLDHVARTPQDPRPNELQYQRAISFFSAYVPHYGTTPFSIASDGELRNVIASWTPPSSNAQKFPNVDRFRVDVARHFDEVRLPSRSTATQLSAHWIGTLDSKWGGTLRVDPYDPIRVDVDAGGGEQMLRGKIINDLPDTLTNVTMIWVKNNRFARRRYAANNGIEAPYPAGLSGQMLNSASYWRLNASYAWTPGKALSLEATLQGTQGDVLANGLKKRYTDPYAKRDFASTTGTLAVTETDRRNYLEMLSFFQQLTPPEYLKGPEDPGLEASVAFHRELGRELDLSAWFNRPCLIVIGFLDNAACPVPLHIDGRDELPVANSLTMVRWIYPLPLDEKIAFRDVMAPGAP